jgi:acetyl-CoA C-acetyltransferase
MSAAIIAARRSAVCPRGGAFARLSLEALGAPVMAAVLADAGLQACDVDEVICANALGAGGNPARRLALAAGLPDRVAGLTIDRQCAGGLDAIRLAVAMVASGQARVVLAGGVESYSRRPLRLQTFPGGAPPVPYDQPPFTPWPDRDPDMTQAAAQLAVRCGISREMQDAWAVASHAKAHMVADWPEIVPVDGVLRDTFMRRLTQAQAQRAHALHGTITAANMAVAADAAAFCLIVAQAPVVTYAGHAPLQIAASATLGAAPDDPGLSPLPAISAVWTGQPLAQVELMEAHAAQALACLTAARFDPAIVNPRGGGLARGHPIGASGTILAVRLFHDLRPGEQGLAAIAAAGGIGTAIRFAR